MKALLGGFSEGFCSVMDKGWREDLHDCEDNVRLIFDRGESYRRDHYDHEVKCLEVISIRARVAKTVIIPNLQKSPEHWREPECVEARSRLGIARSCQASQRRRRY